MKNKQKNAQPSSWVIFEFQPVQKFKDVVVKGAWDNWKGTSMRKKKNGSFYVRKKIPMGDWEYGFECNNKLWQIDPDLKTIATPFDSLNNIIAVGE